MSAQVPPSMFPAASSSASGSGFPGAVGAGGGSGGFPGGIPPNATAAGVSPLAAGAAASAAGAVPIFPFFQPSFDVALLGSIAFVVVAVLHTYLPIITKSWFMMLAAQGALGEYFYLRIRAGPRPEPRSRTRIRRSKSR
jgi:hypothetical protein